MKRFYNNETIKIEEHETFTTFQFNIDVQAVYGIEYYENLNEKIEKYLKKLNSNKPTLFQIVGDFDVLENANEADVIDFIAALSNIFVGNLITKNRAKREYRLGLAMYPEIAKSKLTTMSKMGIINYEIKFPIFQLEIIDTHDNIILSVF